MHKIPFISKKYQYILIKVLSYSSKMMLKCLSCCSIIFTIWERGRSGIKTPWAPSFWEKIFLRRERVNRWKRFLFWKTVLCLQEQALVRREIWSVRSCLILQWQDILRYWRTLLMRDRQWLWHIRWLVIMELHRIWSH